MNFLWQWNDYAPQPDALMTRERLARLMRAWRRAKIQGRRVFAFRRISSSVPGYRAYEVEALRTSNERATVFVRISLK